MDHFERELARMMRDTKEYTPFEAPDRARLRAGVLARRRVRTVRRAAGSVLAVAGLGVGFLLLPHDPGGNGPQAPQPRPATSPVAPSPTPPGPSASPTATGSPTATPEESSTPTTPPTTSGTSDATASAPPPTRTETATPGGTGTPTAPATRSGTPSTVRASATGSADSG